MMEKKIIQRFTWKRFIRLTLFIFVGTILLTVISNFFDNSRSMKEPFASMELLKRAGISVVMGIIFTLTTNPPGEET